jgi:hypothetical protein
MIATVVTAPSTLGIASREDFRRQAMEGLGHVRAAADREELRFLLAVTRLDDRFVIEATAAT